MNAHSFRAHHIPLDVEVFLKVYHADEESVSVFQEPRFLIEATQGQDGSGNLVEVRDAELLGNDFVLLAMEYVDGGSILNALQDEAFGQMDAIRITVGILHGVVQLHSRNLLHRDIKPANVLLQQRDSGLWPKLGDFGSIAQLAKSNEAVSASKHSALYVPPEGWDEPSRYFKISDLYQVGLVLHEMANGPLPYSDLSAYLDREAKGDIRRLGGRRLNDLDQCDASKIVDAAINRNARRGKLIAKGPIMPYVSARLKKIIRKATAAKIINRYQTALEFIGTLETLSLPNWRKSLDSSDVYEAIGWQGFDWRIEPATKRKQLGMSLIHRRKYSSVGYRQWAGCSNIQEASIKVEHYS